MRFERVNERVLRAVLDAIDGDAEFRQRVATARGFFDEGMDVFDDDGALVDTMGAGWVTLDDLEEDGPVDATDMASWLVLARPDGWADELGEMVNEHAAARAEGSAAKADERAAERLDRIEAALADARDEVAALERRTAELVADLDDERSRRREAEGARAAERRRAEEAEEDRARAVKDLGDARRLADRRLEQLREAESRDVASSDVASADVENDSGKNDSGKNDTAVLLSNDELAAEAAAAARDDALNALRGVAQTVSAVTVQLAAALEAAFDQLEGVRPSAGREGGGNGVADVGAAPERQSDGPRRPALDAPTQRARRVPVRLRHGAVEGTREATLQLLGLDDVAVLVDGWNVSMEGWPRLGKGEQRDALIAALGSLGARTGAEFSLIFDGEGDGGRPTVAAPLPVRLYFTAASEEADDAILRMVTEVPMHRPVVAVSSDERVREGVRARGGNVVSSSDLLDVARR